MGADELSTATPNADVSPTEKQPETTPATEPSEKKVEPVTQEKKTSEKETEEETPTPTKELKNLDISSQESEKGTAAATNPTPLPTPSKNDQPTWPETPPEHPLTQFFSSISELVKEADHNEVYGITLSPDSPFLTKLILQKFLRANQNDLAKAKEQLLETLKWRKEFDPVKAVTETFEKERFDGLGWIMEIEGVPESGNQRDVVTFNIYGAVKDNKKTFGDLDGFLRWRVGLMERSIQKLNLAAATKPIPDYGQGPDPYQGFQIHDYLQVSFIRQDPLVKASTKPTIQILGRYYPETLSRKFFVNVPVVMGWFYQAVKLFVAKETIKKFTVLSYGNQLAAELGPGVPAVYGGTAGELRDVAEGMRLA